MSGNKRPRSFCNIFHKTGTILMKYGSIFLHKFAEKSYKRFPPHHYLVKLKMLIAHVLRLSCWRKKLQNLCHLNCGIQTRQIWIRLITVCGKYGREGVQNISLISTYIDYATDEWLPQWQHDPAWPYQFSVTVSVRPDQWCVFCTPSLARTSPFTGDWPETCLRVWQSTGGFLVNAR